MAILNLSKKQKSKFLLVGSFHHLVRTIVSKGLDDPVNSKSNRDHAGAPPDSNTNNVNISI